ncbi:helix-turn-helix transcriptional regulator [Streptomyces sp. AC536]|uniref:helix-turn-helix domain-containing protein n=1 Tax=Streptomyces buecherae TaxID=2763006 RepID=UPI00164D8DC0|nr:helix-turn-helix transcriptional regulator [Streptomyces buecherae]MBC3985776.1 helix-turn-helix transcriptional regulator [Streptomyces buecherae]QNJ41090.1 helix-turn-helix transcriptional regulator [Streptomyces buecherae]
MTSLGRTLKASRALAGGMTQAQLGATCNMSQAKISRIERGAESPTPAERRALARALSIPPAMLGATETDEQNGGEDDMRRRELLVAAAGIGIGAATIPATPATGHGAPGPGWDAALFRDIGKPTMNGAQLHAGLDTVARQIGEARYVEAARAVPHLVAAARAHARHSGPGGAETLARAYVVATAVSVKERTDVSWLTADRSVQAARQARNPVVAAMAARAQYVVLRQRGHHEWAAQVADQAVADLSGEERARPVLAHLLLESAYGAAQAGDTTRAASLYEQARDTAARGPATTTWVDAPGPMTSDQVERYGLCIHHVLGDSRAALKHLAAVNGKRLATREREARVRHDSAKLYRDMGDLPSALALLQQHAEETPQDARRSSVKVMISGMLAVSPSMPGLNQLAVRVGAA